MSQWVKGTGALVLILLFSVVVVACSSQNSEKSGEASATPTVSTDSEVNAKPVKLRINWWGSKLRHDATLAALDLYTKENPNVTFEPAYSGWDGYWDKIATGAAAKQAPDIFQMDLGYVNQYVSNNQLAEITSVNTADMDQQLRDTANVDGKIYAMPIGSNINGMAYNKVAVEKLGIKAPEYDWTWDEYFQFARDAKAKLGKEAYAILDSTNTIEFYDMYQISQGKGSMILDDGTFNLDKATFIKFQNIFIELRKEGAVPPATLSVTFQELDPQHDLLATGQVLIRQLYASQATSIDSMNPGAYAMVSMPKGVQKGGWLTPSMYWSVSSNSPNIMEAQKFIDWFINSTEAGKILGTTRGVPASSKVVEALTPTFTDADKLGVEMLTKAAVDAPPFPMIPEQWQGWREKDYRTVTDKLMFDKSTAEQAYDELVKMAKQYQ